MLDKDRTTDAIMSRLPNIGTTDENEDVRGYVSIVIDEIFKELTTNGEINTTVNTTDDNGDIGTGTGEGTIS